MENERKEFLLDQLFQYRYDKETNMQALQLLKEKIMSLDTIFSSNGNTIAYQSSRIKEENSFLNKINKKYGTDDVLLYEDMHDIVGVRLVCLSLSDVYEFVNLLKTSDINIIDEKDYIKKPKQSGYMSYHVIVEVPVETTSGIKQVKCEIQLRTIFMDIFAREEHKLSYKGMATKEDKVVLKNLSDKLYFYDSALDNLFKINNRKEEVDEDLGVYMQEYDKISYLYGHVYDLLDEKIKEFVKNYDNSDDVLHITSRIKPISSIKRKLIRRNLSATAEDMLYKIRDVVGFKIVCIDEATAKDFISYFTNKINNLEKIEISNVSDRLETPKESGYRGYKMNLSYSLPTITGNQSITVEVLIRTMVMDAWALHDDKIFNNEDSYDDADGYVNASRQLKGLSPALHDVEEKLVELKTNVPILENKQENLVSIVEEYQKEKKQKQLKMVLKESE